MNIVTVGVTVGGRKNGTDSETKGEEEESERPGMSADAYASATQPCSVGE